MVQPFQPNNSRTTLKGHFGSRLSRELAWTVVQNRAVTQLLPDSVSFPSLPQVLNTTALLNILYPKLDLKFCFQKTLTWSMLVVKTKKQTNQ